MFIWSKPFLSFSFHHPYYSHQPRVAKLTYLVYLATFLDTPNRLVREQRYVAKPFRLNTKRMKGQNNNMATTWTRRHGSTLWGMPQTSTLGFNVKWHKSPSVGEAVQIPLRPPPLWHTGLHSLYPSCFILICLLWWKMLYTKIKLKMWIMPNNEHDFIKIGQHKIYSLFIYLLLVDISILGKHVN
jgi:hypothetical protein